MLVLQPSMASYSGIRSAAARDEQHQLPTIHSTNDSEHQVPTLFLAQNPCQSSVDPYGQPTHLPGSATMIQTARMPIQNVIPNSSIVVQRPHYRPSYNNYDTFVPADHHQHQQQQQLGTANLVETQLPIAGLSTTQTSLPAWSSPIQERSPQSAGIQSPSEQRTNSTPCPISSPVSSGKP